MDRSWINLRNLWAALSLGLIVVIILFGLKILTIDPSLQVQYTPDDAYYYLVLARNFARLGQWTFDSGHSITSGFHPLLAYILADIYWLTNPGIDQFVTYGLLLSIAITILAMLLAWRTGLRLETPYYFLFLALITSSRNFIFNSVSSVEWSLVLLIAILTVLQFWHSLADQPSPRPRTLAISLLALGFLGSLARSDFGLLPMSLAVAALLIFLRENDKQPLKTASWVLAGAVAGILFLFAHNYAFTGEILQSSALMKAHWRQTLDTQNQVVADMLLLLQDLMLPEGVNPVWFVLGCLTALVMSAGLLGGVALVRRQRQLWTTREFALLTGMVLCFLGYLLFYTQNADIQPWYSANLIVPLFLILLNTAVFAERLLGPHFIRIVISLLALVIILANLTAIYPLGPDTSRWPHQANKLAAGKSLARLPLDGRVGSWNAGIVGYYEGGHIINLDGLVNNDVYEYAVSNTLPLYLERNNIVYVLDFGSLFEIEWFRRRGGFDDPAFLESLTPLEEFDQIETVYGPMILYQVSP
jgi:hypothetical protein